MSNTHRIITIEDIRRAHRKTTPKPTRHDLTGKDFVFESEDKQSRRYIVQGPCKEPGKEGLWLAIPTDPRSSSDHKLFTTKQIEDCVARKIADWTIRCDDRRGTISLR